MPDATLDDIPDEPEKKDSKKEEPEKREKEEEKETAEKKEKRWVEDEYDTDAEVIKLQVGEGVEGLLLDKYPSSKWKAQIYKIQVKDDDIPKIVVGTTILDKMMKNKELNEPVRIERLEDKPSQKGNPVQHWKTYHLE